MQEVIVDWTTAAGSGFVNVLYFGGLTTAAVARSNVGAVYAELDDELSVDVGWTVRNEGRTIDPSTGVATGFWSDSTPFFGTGEVAETSVPDASQILLQWLTPDVKNGRRVRGRTFIPGLPVTSVLGGNVRIEAQAALSVAAQALADLGNFYVWSRPKSGAGGTEHEVTLGNCWSEMAVLRSRRG